MELYQTVVLAGPGPESLRGLVLNLRGNPDYREAMVSWHGGPIQWVPVKDLRHVSDFPEVK